jgi:hypothetical protein
VHCDTVGGWGGVHVINLSLNKLIYKHVYDAA